MNRMDVGRIHGLCAEAISGQLKTTEILDTTGQTHAIQRKEIASLTISPLSIMPSDDLKALLECLTRQAQPASP